MKRLLAAIALAGAIGLTPAAANAVLSVQEGNTPQVDDNVIDNPSCSGGVVGPALTIKGCFNKDHNQLVDFTSDELLVYAGGGQAQIVSDDGNGFSTLTIKVEGKFINTLILNIDAIEQKPHDVLSKVKFNDGVTFSSLFALGKGQNFFTLTGGPFPFITFDIFGAPAYSVSLDDATDVK